MRYLFVQPEFWCQDIYLWPKSVHLLEKVFTESLEAITWDAVGLDGKWVTFQLEGGPPDPGKINGGEMGPI